MNSMSEITRERLERWTKKNTIKRAVADKVKRLDKEEDLPTNFPQTDINKEMNHAPSTDSE